MHFDHGSNTITITGNILYIMCIVDYTIELCVTLGVKAF